MSAYLSWNDVFYAMLLALLLTWTVISILRIAKIYKKLTTTFIINDPEAGKTKLLNRCYALFPVEKLVFKGETFIKGMKVKVVTAQNKIFEGEFIGTNSKNVVCILTKQYVVAHEIKNIAEIKLLEQ